MFITLFLIACVPITFTESSLYTNVFGGAITIPGNPVPLYSSNTLDLFRGIPLRRLCPVCAPSVFSYCTDKLLHDSCCCYNPNNPYDSRPYQCKYADCSFLHANSCQEHKLITACCCISKK